ncbi:MAG: CDP-alcohol phosphatidyltransferase family protein [Bacteroidales bacterium]|nr:CDP-alcohol phosphatidyltransferase family protein [Bacteroidales bacterium]
MERKQANRIQTSILNGLEKKVLVWLADRQPSWMTSDCLSFIGFLGSVMIALGYALTSKSVAFLWLSSLGFVINWYGDSLDGTLARVRNKQRPVYGYYLDHTLDCINELIMFIGLGLSPLMDMRVALMLLVCYLLMTVNVSVNAHLKSEFKLTYAKLGPTELRIIAIIFNTILALSTILREFSTSSNILGRDVTLTALDMGGIAVAGIIFIMYIVTIVRDAAGYAKIDPKK